MHNREILEKPFKKSMVRKRKGPSGRVFSYVEGADYIRRLNEAFDGKWSFEIVEHRIEEREVVVLGKLTAAGITKVAFGGSSITTSARSSERVSLADDLKAAATDALKKASSLFGLGLDLNSHAAADGAPAWERGRKNDAESLASPRGVTERQLNAIMAIGRKLGWSRAVLEEHCFERYETTLSQMSKTDASAMIDELRGLSATEAA